MLRRPRTWSGTLLAVAYLGTTAMAQPSGRKYAELLKRVPDQANVIMLVDVDGLFQSKFGQREKWRERALSHATAGLGLADDVTRIVVAEDLDLSSLDESWKLGLAEVRGTLPDLARIAAREGGYVEKIRSVPVAWTPRGFSLITFPPRIVGFVDGADRQALGKWLGSTLARPRNFPPGFADRAINRAEAGSQIVIAMNLDESVSADRAEPWLKALPGVAKARLDPKLLAQKLAAAKSASLQVDVGEAMTGTLRIDFQAAIDYAAPVLKELILALAEDYGTMLPELESWNLRLEPNKQAVELTGRLGEESARRILSLARPPSQIGTGPRTTSGDASPRDAAEKGPAELSRDDVARTSQRYFRSVTDLLNGIKQTSRPNYSSLKLWYDRYAKQIEELPILGVDSDLLDWGSLVARTLREMSSGINYNSKDQTYRVAGTPNGSYGGYGYYGGNDKAYSASVIRKQSGAVLSVQLDGKWQAIETSIADMRRKMVEKYKVDF
jgi:hypothetical protein